MAEEDLLKKAKLRAMYLLNICDRAEAELREKLKKNEYPQEIIEQAIQYVKSFGYINDLRYAENFIRSRKEKKSKKEILYLLSEKGIASEIIASAVEEYYHEEDGVLAIRALLKKKHYESKTADDKERQKTYGYLARKGFSYRDIMKALQAEEEI